MPVTAELGVVMAPVPATNDQTPVPIPGVLATNVVVEAHKVCVAPAFEIVGNAFTTIDVVEVVLAHTPYDILHCKTVVPVVNPVTALLGEFGDVTTPPPDNTDQVPKPTEGVLADNVAVPGLTQTVWEVPATLAGGTLLIVIVVVVIDGGQVPLDILH